MKLCLCTLSRPLLASRVNAGCRHLHEVLIFFVSPFLNCSEAWFALLDKLNKARRSESTGTNLQQLNKKMTMWNLFLRLVFGFFYASIDKRGQ